MHVIIKAHIIIIPLVCLCIRIKAILLKCVVLNKLYMSVYLTLADPAKVVLQYELLLTYTENSLQ